MYSWWWVSVGKFSVVGELVAVGVLVPVGVLVTMRLFVAMGVRIWVLWLGSYLG